MFNTEITNLQGGNSYNKRLLLCSDGCLGSIGIDTYSNVLQGEVFPVGAILDFHHQTAKFTIDIPDGWKLCDGSTFDKNVYQTVYKLLGSDKLPNLNGKLLGMRDEAMRVFADTTGVNKLGSEFGVYEETMTMQTLPSHTHKYTDTRRYGGPEFNNDGNDNGNAMMPSNFFNPETKVTTETGNATPTPIPNRQPSITTLKIIKMI